MLRGQDEWGRLQDFEDGGLSRWTLTGGGSLAIDSVYATERKHDLRVEFATGARLTVDLTGIWRMEEIIREKFNDEGGGGWKIYEAFFFDVYAPEPVGLLVTFTDGTGGMWQSLRNLKKGLNLLQFRREELQGVDFSSLAQVAFSPARACRLYIDHLRTWEYQPELDSRGKMDIIYSDSVSSPHLDWQNPDAAGAIRGLFVPRAYAGRVMVGLMQRFEIQPTTVTFEPSLGLHRWAFGDFYGTRALGYDHVTDKFSISYTDLTSELESEKEFDVIVLPPMRGWENWPPELRAALLDRVRKGCGLVLFQPTDLAGDSTFRALSPLDGEVRIEQVRLRETDQPEEMPGGIRRSLWKKTGAGHYITRGLPLELVPTGDVEHLSYTAPDAEVLIETDQGAPILAVGTYGKGRVAALAWVDAGMFPRIDSPLDEKNGLPYWEYLYALVGRTIRWAAGRDDPATRIGGLAVSPGRTGKGITVAGRITSQAGDSVRVALRNPAWETVGRATLAAPADGAFEAAFPEVTPGSRMIADLKLVRPGGRVADFATVSAEFPVKPLVERIALDRETVKLGETVAGEVTVSAVPARLALLLTDNRDRLLAADTLELAESLTYRFAFPSLGCLARRAVVTARTLGPGGNLLHSTERALFIDRPAAWDDYEVMMYRFMPEIEAGEWKFLDRYLESLGVTAWAAIEPDFVFRSNLGIQAETRLDTEESLDGPGEIPYRDQKKNYLATHDKKYLQRTNCLHDSAYLAEQKRVIEQKVSQFKKFSPLSYYCYEEPSLTHYGDAFDFCFSSHTLTAFRQWLKEQYGGLEALNGQWGTSFGSWEEVIPDDTFEAQARGNYSSWADHRTFMEISYANNYAYVRSLVRSVDNDGLVMMTGTQRTVPQNGYDYYLLDRTIDHTQPYGEPERHKAFMREDGKITGCTGYGVWGPKLDYELWSRLFSGHTAGSAIFWQFSTLDPDYRLSKSGRDMLNVFGELRHKGLARLVKSARWSPGEVVLLWSMPSIHGTWIQDGKIIEADGAPSRIFQRWESNYESWRWLLEDLGVPYRVMSSQMLEDGWLESAGAKILVLPNTIALSGAAAENIRRFAEAGGSVIADAQAAQMDGHCRWLENGALDSAFGVRTTGGPIPAGEETVRREGLWGLATADSRLSGQGAEALVFGPGLPVVYRNPAGAGKAYTLNAFVSGYGVLRADGSERAVRNSAAMLLRDAGHQPRIRIRPASGRDLRAVKMTTYDLGEQGHLVGLIKDYRVAEPPRDVEVVLPAELYNYDVREGRYLGHGDKLRTTISTGEVKLLASLPYQVSEVVLELPRTAKRGREVGFSFRVAAAGEEGALPVKFGPHVFVVEVYGPQGNRVGWYGGNVAAPEGGGRSSFPLALSDSPGQWRVRVRDVATGVFTERYIEVQ
ncbi:MAG: beta-galactosidase [Candidatus Glassbacteria bacterium]